MDIEEPTWSNYQPSFEHAGLLARPLQLPHPTLWTSGCTSRIADEAQNQWFLMAHATKLVPFRVNTDMLSVMFVTQLVLSNDEHLLVGEGVAASPFVNAGIKTIPHILNTGMICGILAISAESICLASGILRTMSRKNFIPEDFAKVNSKGHPRWVLRITCVPLLPF